MYSTSKCELTNKLDGGGACEAPFGTNVIRHENRCDGIFLQGKRLYERSNVKIIFINSDIVTFIFITLIYSDRKYQCTLSIVISTFDLRLLTHSKGQCQGRINWYHNRHMTETVDVVVTSLKISPTRWSQER